MSSASLRPIARMAWRDARRDWRRSLLTAFAVVVPVAFGAYLGPAAVGLGPFNLIVLLMLTVVIGLSVGAVIAVSTKRRVVRYGRLTAIGADPGQIRKLLFLEAAAPTAVAFLVGLILGSAVSLFQGPYRWFLEDAGRTEAGFALLTPFPTVVHVVLLIVSGTLALASSVGVWFAVGPAANMALQAPNAETGTHGAPEPEPRSRQLLIGVVIITGSLVAAVGFQQFSFNVLALSVLLVFVGLHLIMAPLLLNLERWSVRLPLPVRLAARNGARNRTRLGRLTLASLTTVALGVMAAAGIASDSPDNPASGRSGPLDERFLLLSTLPSGAETVDHQLIRESVSVTAEADLVFVFSPLQLIHSRSDDYYSASGLSVALFTPELIEALNPDPGTLNALDRGEVILASGVTKPIAVADRDVNDPAQDYPSHSAQLGFGEGRYLVGNTIESGHLALISPEAADELGAWPLPDHRQRLFVSETPISEQQRSVLTDGLRNHALVSGTGIGDTAIQRLVAAVATGLLFFFGLIGAALTGMETEREISTMIATGARPSIRRWFRAAQAGLQMFTAGVLGAPLGVLLFWAVTRTDQSVPNAIFPWETMVLLGLAVPTAVVLVVAAATGAGSPAVSRRAMI